MKISFREKRMKMIRTESPRTVGQLQKVLSMYNIMGLPEGEEREKGPEDMFEEMMAENFPDE